VVVAYRVVVDSMQVVFLHAPGIDFCNFCAEKTKSGEYNKEDVCLPKLRKFMEDIKRGRILFLPLSYLYAIQFPFPKFNASF
jgi:hypothetical protein